MSALSPRQTFLLDEACKPIRQAFRTPPYLVGTASQPRGDRAPRDVDVRLIVDDELYDQLAAITNTAGLLPFLGLAIGEYLAARTGFRSTSRFSGRPRRTPITADRATRSASARWPTTAAMLHPRPEQVTRMADLQRAAARLRREGPSVHHALCDLRRPPVGPPKCTCRVSDVASAVADLLEAVATAAEDYGVNGAAAYYAAEPLAAAILGGDDDANA